jgi:hypothetical protein
VAKLRTAREWLLAADFESVNEPLFESFVAKVGFDKADECRAMMKRIAENLLDALDERRLTEDSMLRLLRAVSSIAIDNTFPHERQ